MIEPQLARVGFTSPRKASPASMAMARSTAEMRPAIRTSPTSGRTWVRSTWPVLAPKPTAARMSARRRRGSTAARTSRAYTGHDTSTMIADSPTTSGLTDAPSTTISGIGGRTRTTSTTRMTTESVAPPRQPATAPASAPSSSVPPPASRAMTSDVRAPDKSWLVRSWPTELVPNRWCRLGPSSGSPASSVTR